MNIWNNHIYIYIYIYIKQIIKNHEDKSLINQKDLKKKQY